MLVLGLGNDMIDIRRIQSSLDRFGERFIHRIYTEVEIAKSERRRNRAASYAKRFAAKEACAKALGTGINRGVYWRDMGVVNLPGGKPTLRLTNGASARLRSLSPAGFVPQISLTITDDDPWAQAMVLITALPREMAVQAGLEEVEA